MEEVLKEAEGDFDEPFANGSDEELNACRKVSKI